MTHTDPFTTSNLLQGYWITISEHGYSFVLQFQEGGLLRESPLFDSAVLPAPQGVLRWWQGAWQVDNRHLVIEVQRYRLQVNSQAALPGIYDGLETIGQDPSYRVAVCLIHPTGPLAQRSD